MVVSVLALLPHTLKVTSPKFGWESGCPFDDFFMIIHSTRTLKFIVVKVIVIILKMMRVRMNQVKKSTKGDT
jgi:hypothetical protein